jgi:drug/metabolite transporter (DMT)-like permease
LLVFISGLMGSLFPAYFFCVAQEHVESSLAGSLNALTPIFVIVLGALFFRTRTATIQVLGILLSFCGSILLYAGHSGFSIDSGIFYAFLILLATLAYGVNVNLVNRYLTGISSSDIAVVAIVLIAIPATIVLGLTDFFERDPGISGFQKAVTYTVLLGILGTSLASVIFYMLIKRAGPVFSSMVTYGIPLVANFWGFVFGERVGLWQILCLLLILAGVFLATRKPKSVPPA